MGDRSRSSKPDTAYPSWLEGLDFQAINREPYVRLPDRFFNFEGLFSVGDYLHLPLPNPSGGLVLV